MRPAYRSHIDVHHTKPNYVFIFLQALCSFATLILPSVASSATPSGTLTLASRTCVIPIGSNSCNVSISWKTSNPVGISAITSNYPSANTTVATGNSGSISAAVPYAGRSFYLYNNAKELASSSATASCATGSTWNGSSCARTTQSKVTVYYQPTPFPAKKYDGSPMPQDMKIVHAWTCWLPSVYYQRTLQCDSRLQVGGWGDTYRTYVRFDLTGLPTDVDEALLWLMPFSRGDLSTPTAYTVCQAAMSWDLSMTWNTQPNSGACQGVASPPVTGSWVKIPLTTVGGPDWYNQWRNGTASNNGVMLLPQSVNNNFNMFRSTLFADYANDPDADAKRPQLQLTFTKPADMPNFLMPLPAGYNWLLTNEIGGYECTGQSPWPDTAHGDDGSIGNFYSIDISYNNLDSDGRKNTFYGSANTPVLAAASGTIIVNSDSGNEFPNGYYVVIDHDHGYSTRYLHLKDIPRRRDGTAFRTGDFVRQGDQIGIMGSTGHLINGAATSTGVHLHFGLRFNDHGFSTTKELTKALVEGRLLKSFQTECELDGGGVPLRPIRYYRSSNVQTGQ
jgi:murein DD-endopeptidase MepM/ murein hydrolase activator NlpD